MIYLYDLLHQIEYKDNIIYIYIDFEMLRLIRYNNIIVTMITVVSISIVCSNIPFVKSKISTIKNNNYIHYLNNTFDNFKNNIGNVGIKNRFDPFTSIISNFKNLYYPFEKRIPLYYNIETDTGDS